MEAPLKCQGEVHYNNYNSNINIGGQCTCTEPYHHLFITPTHTIRTPQTITALAALRQGYILFPSDTMISLFEMRVHTEDAIP